MAPLSFRWVFGDTNVERPVCALEDVAEKH